MTNNNFSREPEIQVLSADDWAKNAERVNGWSAMLGVMAAIGAYLSTGQLIPGIL